MKSITYFTAKIKIGHFELNLISDVFRYRPLYEGKNILDVQEVLVNQGLLEKNVTLQGELKSTDLTKFNKIKIDLIEKKGSKIENIGLIHISLDQFQHVKVKKMHLQSCFDNSAYIEAFLLLVPTKIVENPQQSIESEVSSFKSDSLVQVQYHHQTESELTFSHLQEENVLFELGKTSEKKDQEVQTLDIQTLLTENNALFNLNSKLVKENEMLKNQLKSLSSKMNDIKKLKELSLKQEGQVEELKKKIISVQAQLKEKDQMIEVLKNQQQSLQKEKSLSSLKDFQEEIKIDSIVSQLGKYSQTVKKYKMSMNMVKSKRTESTLSESVLTQSTIAQDPPQKKRNRKNELLLLLRAHDGETSKSEQTLDSMRGSVVNMQND